MGKLIYLKDLMRNTVVKNMEADGKARELQNQGGKTWQGRKWRTNNYNIVKNKINNICTRLIIYKS